MRWMVVMIVGGGMVMLRGKMLVGAGLRFHNINMKFKRGVGTVYI